MHRPAIGEAQNERNSSESGKDDRAAAAQFDRIDISRFADALPPLRDVLRRVLREKPPIFR